MQTTITIPSTRKIFQALGFILFIIIAAFLSINMEARGWNALSAIATLIGWILITGISLHSINTNKNQNSQYCLGMALVLAGVLFIPVLEIIHALPDSPDKDFQVRLLYMENFVMTVAAVVGGSVMADAIYSEPIASNEPKAAIWAITLTNIAAFMVITALGSNIATADPNIMTTISYWMMGLIFVSIFLIYISRKRISMGKIFLVGLLWIAGAGLPPFFWQMDFGNSSDAHLSSFFTLWRNFYLYFWGGLGSGALVNALRIIR